MNSGQTQGTKVETISLHTIARKCIPSDFRFASERNFGKINVTKPKIYYNLRPNSEGPVSTL